MRYDEEVKLRHDLRVAESARDFYRRRWEKACKIMSDNRVGPYKYTENAEQRFRRRLDNTCERIKIRADIAVNNIRISFSEHEVMMYTIFGGNNPDKIVYLTDGILFEQLKNKEK